jgi:6-phosphogluconolactonase (cycloisomerase 2 family)
MNVGPSPFNKCTGGQIKGLRTIMNAYQRLVFFTASALTLALAACGGGGGGGGGSNFTPALIPGSNSVPPSGGNDAAPDAPSDSAKFTIGMTVSGLASGQQLTLQNNGGDSLVVSADGAFAFATAVAAGGSYDVTVGAQPTRQVCSVTSGSGTAITADVNTVSVSCSTAHNVYVSDGANAQILQYVIQADGTLAPLSSPVATPAAPSFGMAVDPSGKYLYATIGSLNVVQQFNIGADGNLTPMSAAPVPTGNAPYKAVVSPDGKYLFVGNQADASVSSYGIAGDGSLTQIGTYSCTFDCQNTQGLAVDPSSSRLFIVGAQNSELVAMTIGSDGSLSNPLSQFAFVTNPAFVAIDPTGSYLITSAGSSIAELAIDPGTGALTFAAIVPASGSGATQMAFDPSGSHLYQGMSTSATVEQLSWSAGALSALTPPAVSAGASQSGVAGMVIDPSGSYVYTLNRGSKDISQFVVGSGGLLSANPVSGIAAIPSSPAPDPYSIVIR